MGTFRYLGDRTAGRVVQSLGIVLQNYVLDGGEADDPSFARVIVSTLFAQPMRSDCGCTESLPSLRAGLGWATKQPKLGTLLPLSVRLLPTEFLGERVLPIRSQHVPSLCAGNANSGLQQAMAQCLS